MSIKRFTTFCLILTALLLLLLLLTVYRAYEIQNDITDKERYRFNSNLLAIELFQSSEDLTRMARSYVVTGDRAFKDDFFEILAIRNGQIPRPSDYSLTYWHLAGIGKAPANAPGEKIALVALMQQQGLTGEELALLLESQQYSDQLVAQELRAFAALEGYFADDRGELTIRGEPNRELAKALLFGEAYADEKARIMQPLEEFKALLNERTQAELTATQHQLKQQILAAIAILMFLMVGMIAITFYIRRNILRPLDNLTLQTEAIRHGEYSTRCWTEGSNEVATLGENFNRMAIAIEQAINRFRQTENLLQHSESRLKEAQRLTQIGNWELNLASGVLYWSDEIFNIFEIDQSNFSASYESFLSLIHPDDRHKVDQAYKYSLESKVPFEISHRLFMPDGRIKWVNERCKTFYDEQGNPLRSVGTIQDISERIRVDRMKREFIATVSHELRTPLTAIRGALGLLKSGVTGELPVKAKQFVDMASQSCERLIHLINDLLDIGKIEAGKMQLKIKPLSLQLLIEEAIKENQVLADQFKVRLKLMNELPGIMIDADGNRIMQILNNLLSNAAKFSKPDEEVQIGLQQIDTEVCVWVSNKGPGISEEFKGEVFEKFFQSDSSDSRQQGGTGLGLAITKELVELMGGTITFESQPNVLTTFFIKFPISAAANNKP